MVKLIKISNLLKSVISRKIHGNTLKSLSYILLKTKLFSAKLF